MQSIKNRTTRSLSSGERDQIYAIAQDKPNIEELTKTVGDVLQKYNLVVAEVYKDAQSAK